ncbi:DUF3800 domain-containing protein [Methylocystis echinoides]|uniref:DUF3800 domain-containing protein n=1 Tax=Methylocystis echinoides TaxID=29468 RepID=UPI00343703BF
MSYIAFIDESGDHGLEVIDPSSPVFVLGCALYQTDDYLGKETPLMTKLKIERWGHEGVVFHSYEIRKKRGQFSFCADSSEAKKLHQEIGDFFKKSSATLIAAAIDKERHKKQYSSPEDPYFLSMQFVLERIHKATYGRVHLVFESRGVKENAIVSNWTNEICGGRNYRSKKFDFTHCFSEKKFNVTGLQVADLASYPISHFVRNRETKRPDWVAVKPRLRQSMDGQIIGYGLKIFPS